MALPRGQDVGATAEAATWVGRKLPPVHPGEILQTEFLIPFGLRQVRLARDISVPPRRINGIVRGQRAMSADTALRLARYFATSERFWSNLQIRDDLEVERDRLGNRLLREVRVRSLVISAMAEARHACPRRDRRYP